MTNSVSDTGVICSTEAGTHQFISGPPGVLHFDGFPWDALHGLHAHQVTAVSLRARPQVPRLKPRGQCPFSTLCA